MIVMLATDKRKSGIVRAVAGYAKNMTQSPLQMTTIGGAVQLAEFGVIRAGD